ncbi:MAG: signal peptidase II [Actinobacteria bacterium]|nr:signal peptidase II [Actinomycetota bacterium]
MSALRRWAIVAASAGVVLLADQLTKRWAVERLRDRPPIDVIWTLRFTYAENTGMAFSKGSGAGRIIAVVVMAIVVALVLLARKVRSPWGLVLIGIVIGGAFGNLFDRVFRAGSGFLTGAVVDWIDLQWWPVFNIADAAVVVGGLLIALFLLREPDEPVDPTPDPSGDA